MNELRVYDRISDAVGWTPMVRLNRSVEGTGCEVFAKLEFLNPMGSVKDRIARYMVEEALADGRLQRGGVVIENSSGNTAMGLAMMGILEGLHCTMVVRRQTSKEKLDTLRALGVELVLVDGTLPPEHPDSYNQAAKHLLAENPSAFSPDQHNNRENSEAHFHTTGPEIWRQMAGKIDYLVAGIGTSSRTRQSGSSQWIPRVRSSSTTSTGDAWVIPVGTCSRVSATRRSSAARTSTSSTTCIGSRTVMRSPRLANWRAARRFSPAVRAEPRSGGCASWPDRWTPRRVS
jgi:threonine dehydratase